MYPLTSQALCRGGLSDANLLHTHTHVVTHTAPGLLERGEKKGFECGFEFVETACDVGVLEGVVYLHVRVYRFRVHMETEKVVPFDLLEHCDRVYLSGCEGSYLNSTCYAVQYCCPLVI